MPNIKEMINIIKNTPSDQNIMLEGVHGIGKSEVLKNHFQDLGYNVIVLFLGQMSDAGDILGLPDRIEVNGTKVTTFCPPSWWPMKENEKTIIFLDELNRAKPEILQVIMDMLLNKRLYTRNLPKDTRIISAINPINKGEYQVEELDPALLDRFNKYEFMPTADEWLSWASKNQLHSFVTGFISKHNDHLLPPSGEMKQGEVYPSPRSWKRVSDVLNMNKKLETSLILLQNIMLGIVGTRSTSAFGKYIREAQKGINVGQMLSFWNKKFEEQIKAMQTQDLTHLNREICSYFRKEEKVFGDDEALNLQKYIELVPGEVMAELLNLMHDATAAKETWPDKILKLNPDIADRMIDILTGENGLPKDI